MNKELELLKDNIAKDYARWRARGEYGSESDFESFRSQIDIEEGRKYYKIVKSDSQRMVWGFVQKADDKKFQAGDILKAASWAAPARNKARGNVLAEDFSWVRWTGPEYL